MTIIQPRRRVPSRSVLAMIRATRRFVQKTLVAYSAKGYESKTWTLPPGWEGVKRVTVSEIKPDGLKQLNVLDVKDGAITLSLTKQQGVIIEPLEKARNENKQYAYVIRQ